MQAFAFAGSFEDAAGTELLTWQARPSTTSVGPGFELQTTIRGIEFAGTDLDALEPRDAERARDAGFVIDHVQTLCACRLAGDLPITVTDDGAPRRGVLRFRLRLASPGGAPHERRALDLVITARGEAYAVADDWFEDGMLRLGQLLPDGVELVCCLTCGLSDYSPYGHGLLGMRCHRDVAQQYLAVRGKHDYFAVPVTENVMETYLCDRYTPRVPGTGYRG